MNYNQGIYKLPLFGKGLRWLHRVLTIGRIETRLSEQLAHQAQLIRDQDTRMQQLAAAVQAADLGLSKGIGEVGEALRSNLDHTIATGERLSADIKQTDLALRASFAESLQSFRGEISHAMTGLRNDWKATLATNSRVIEGTTRALMAGKQPEPVLNGGARLASPESYLKFEDAFRGQWKVEERVRWYIPQVQEVFTQTGTRKSCLDIGCGRGEWMLELKRNNFNVVGVDLNPAMAEAARAKGLDVVLSDAVAHLNSLDPGSLAVVSAFHLVEHLPFEQILNLVDAVYRALMPGGLLILETPNPENLVVGACTFWYDPTHIRPLPPAMLGFYVQSAGFEPVKTARFYLRMDGPDHATVDQPVQPSIDGPLDYGLLARKPR